MSTLLLADGDSLHVRGETLEDAALLRITAAVDGARLQDIDVSENRISAQGLEQFFRSLSGPLALTSLDISRNPFRHCAQVLARVLEQVPYRSYFSIVSKFQF